MSNDLSALTGLQAMRCGGCGGDRFKVFTADRTQRIVVQCQQCMSTSFIEPVPAKLQINWGEGDGCITVF